VATCDRANSVPQAVEEVGVQLCEEIGCVATQKELATVTPSLR
jgi:hypothetical protein